MTRVLLGWYDRLGVALVVAFVVWTVLSAVAGGGDAWHQVALIVAAAVGYTLARTRGSEHVVVVTAAIVIGILVSVIASGPDAFSGAPLAPVLGYANANAALYTLGVAAAAIVATFAEWRWARWLGWTLALVMLAFAVINTSKAGVALAIAVLIVAVAARWLGRWVALLAPLLVLGAVGVTVALGLTYGTATVPTLEEGLTERRIVLWSEALDIAVDEPIFGVGPGMFAETSPTALSDADARWAHSAYFEVAAETGIVGAVLLIAVLFWTYGTLYRSLQDPRLVVIGTAAVTALAIHAAIDYVAHFAAVVLIAAILAGLASGPAARNPGSAHR